MNVYTRTKDLEFLII